MERNSKQKVGAKGVVTGAGILRALRTMHEQYSFTPKVEGGRIAHRDRYFAVGMGGSALAADLLAVINPSARVMIHRGYGLPTLPPKELKQYLAVLISYSGNTEEVLSAFQEAHEKGVAMVCIAAGGALLERARAAGIPFIQLPSAHIQPRMATGYIMRALLKAIGDDTTFKMLGRLARGWRATSFEPLGIGLAERLYGHIPLIYASSRNASIAYIWKIKMNETAKIPAFTNAFPELNHNEMTGFDVGPKTQSISARILFIFLEDAKDDPRIRRRMEITARLLSARGFRIERVVIQGQTPAHAVFSSLAFADWTAYHLARRYRVDPEEVPMVETLKRMLS